MGIWKEEIERFPLIFVALVSELCGKRGGWRKTILRNRKFILVLIIPLANIAATTPTSGVSLQKLVIWKEEIKRFLLVSTPLVSEHCGKRGSWRKTAIKKRKLTKDLQGMMIDKGTTAQITGVLF